MGTAISLPNGELISLGLTTFLYGLFFALFFVTVIMTFYLRESTRQLHIKILPVPFLMLLVATAHLVVLWIRAVQAFIVQKGGSALAFYDDLSDATSVARVICLVIQCILGDFVIIWRLYVVYGKRLWVVLPALILVTSYTVVGSVAILYIQRARPGTNIFTVAKSWITAYFSMTMSTNLMCSGAIAARIFYVWKSQTRGNVRPYWGIVAIIIESSALYALGVLAALVSFVSGTNGQYPAVDAIVPLVGIVFCLIAIQIRLRASLTSSTCIFSREPVSTETNGRRPRENNSIAAITTGEEFSDKPTRAIPMTIHVTRQTTHVLDCLDGGEPTPYSLSDIVKSSG
ncbi:hypothetical protein DFH94DRAFT_400009 [Russula ochroleuca]|uniref:Uncharacterized protein n=1 Tax=Russula ochroleuca TaxID=152965 RepID=A0A9P5MY28_9AGAM|nr:hypothetical protein DFH94DRAFT_400009 [Russula ochroleuca]